MYRKILVPIDGSSTAERGLTEAIALARLTHGRLRLVHVVDELSFALAMDAYAGFAGDWIEQLRKDGKKLLEEAQGRAARDGVQADIVLCEAFRSPVHEQVIAEAFASNADLIVIGTHGRRGVGRWILGSSAEHILRTSPVPVLLVRGIANDGSGHLASTHEEEHR